MSSKPTDTTTVLESVSNAIANVADKLSPSVVRVGAGRWRGGTGTVWTKDGHIVTSNHVLGRMGEIEVGFSDGSKHVAKVVGRDPYSDIAVLKIDNDNLKPVEPGDSDSLKVGQFVLALANPMGQHASATYGIVTNPSYSIRSWWSGAPNKVVVSDARLNPGYSGGPLVDAKGRVIGINAAYANNRGISIPVNTVRQVVDKLIQHGKIKHAYLGIVGEAVNLPEDLAQQHGQTSGLIVYNVEADSAAKKAGLAMGDVIIKLEDKKVEDIMDLHEMLDDKAIGKRLRITILRGEKLTELTATPSESES